MRPARWQRPEAGHLALLPQAMAIQEARFAARQREHKQSLGHIREKSEAALQRREVAAPIIAHLENQA